LVPSRVPSASQLLIFSREHRQDESRFILSEEEQAHPAGFGG
jgi:hypothetical protein